MANGNGWAKYLIGVAILVTGAVIVGSTGNTVANTVGRGRLEVQVESNKEEITSQKAAIAKIPVMAEQIKDIKEDIGEIKDFQHDILEEIRKK